MSAPKAVRYALRIACQCSDTTPTLTELVWHGPCPTVWPASVRLAPARASQSDLSLPGSRRPGFFIRRRRLAHPLCLCRVDLLDLQSSCYRCQIKVNAMRIASQYSHLHGREYLLVRRPDIWREIETVVHGVNAIRQGTVSHTCSRTGQRSDLGDTLRGGFVAKGWRNPKRPQGRTRYVKSRVGLEICVGEAPHGCSDMLAEHLASFVFDEIDVGVRVAPMEALRKELGTGTWSFEQGLEDIRRYPRGQPAVPLALVGIAA